MRVFEVSLPWGESQPYRTCHQSFRCLQDFQWGGSGPRCPQRWSEHWVRIRDVKLKRSHLEHLSDNGKTIRGGKSFFHSETDLLVDDVHLHGELLPVDRVLRALRVVGAPVEMQLQHLITLTLAENRSEWNKWWDKSYGLFRFFFLIVNNLLTQSWYHHFQSHGQRRALQCGRCWSPGWMDGYLKYQGWNFL